MDTPEKQKVPWWRRKRWRAIGLLWLVLLLPLLYGLSIGPAAYALNRGWLSLPTYMDVYRPLVNPGPAQRTVQGYASWCARRGESRRQVEMKARWEERWSRPTVPGNPTPLPVE